MEPQSSCSESDSSSSTSFEQVQADFEFFDPSLDDVAAIQLFLRDWMGRDNNLVDTWALAQVIGKQDTVGTVIRLEGSSDCLGFITCLNAKYVWNELSSLFPFLRERFESRQQLQVFENCCLNNPQKLGIVISERVSNLPPQLSPWLQQALMDELEWATQDEPTQERREMFDFEYFLYITQVYLDSSALKRKRKKRFSSTSNYDQLSTEQLLFIKAEDQGYYLHQTSWCLWPVSRGESLEKYKMAMILSKDQMIKAKKYTAEQISNTQ
ncbi:hypothetical protein GpartN1_g6709.t1 [Galdieria partita]|uniref:Uncharacterized protein n=1 Tax=Galdieria partita TaxID=83374 RepID=A0A9C7UTJ2_9RHOD|nr:hypothetical protein GpartN1_g6709.t1 [Galdieria partita]